MSGAAAAPGRSGTRRVCSGRSPTASRWPTAATWSGQKRSWPRGSPCEMPPSRAARSDRKGRRPHQHPQRPRQPLECRSRPRRHRRRHQHPRLERPRPRRGPRRRLLGRAAGWTPTRCWESRATPQLAPSAKPSAPCPYGTTRTKTSVTQALLRHLSRSPRPTRLSGTEFGLEFREICAHFGA